MLMMLIPRSRIDQWEALIRKTSSANNQTGFDVTSVTFKFQPVIVRRRPSSYCKRYLFNDNQQDLELSQEALGLILCIICLLKICPHEWSICIRSWSSTTWNTMSEPMNRLNIFPMKDSHWSSSFLNSIVIMDDNSLFTFGFLNDQHLTVLQSNSGKIPSSWIKNCHIFF